MTDLLRSFAAAAFALVAAILPVAPAPAADAVRGEALYKRCVACHSIERNRTGPKHACLIGRPAGSVEGYAYSKALVASGLVWDEATLDRFLAAPREAVPGTKMTYAGVKDAAERADLIAYLKTFSGPEAGCPATTP